MALIQPGFPPHRGQRASLMLERDPFLAQLHAYAGEAAAGHGRLVFVGGEMGIGKTSLVELFQRQCADAVPFTILSCDGLRIHGPLGPLLDIAYALGPDVERLLRDEAPRDQVFRAVEAALATAPGLVIIGAEDVHWADEASLDLLYFLGRRIGALRALLVATYRDDELPGGHPLRRVLGDLVTSPNVRRMTLPPLSLEAVSLLVRGSTVDAGELHAYTGGNPFLVREILEAGTPHPITIQDASLARAGRLSPEVRAFLDTAAIVGPSIDPDILETITGASITEAVDACIAVGLFSTGETGVRFRHAAIREAIVRSLSPMRRLELHRRAYAVLHGHPRLGDDHALLAFHAEEAANGAGALTHAVAAAEAAMRYRSHREAAAQYDRALRHCPQQPVEHRLDLLVRCAHAHYLTGHVDLAVALQEQAVELCRLDPVSRRLGERLGDLCLYVWFHGNTARAFDLAREALAILESHPDSREFARACSNYSQLCMLAHDRDEAIAWGTRAMALASELGDTATFVHAMTNVGSSKSQYDAEVGSSLLRRAWEMAAAADFEADAARAVINLAWNATWAGEVELARRFLDDGLAYTDARDLPLFNQYLQAIRAQGCASTGDWDGASEIARNVLRHPTATPASRIVALVALGLSRVRQGDFSGNELDEALELAKPTLEFQRLGPVYAARAEAAWLANDMEGAAAEAAAVIDLARERPHPWFSGALAMWLWRTGAGWPDIDDAIFAAPYRLMKAGSWRAAASAWRERANPIEEGRALACSTAESDLRAALGVFDRAGARPDAARVTSRMRALGFRSVPRGARASTHTSFSTLTPREVEVLTLVAADATNADIAQRLFLSKRTVEHHVSAILAKLEVPTRGAAAIRAREAGLTSA